MSNTIARNIQTGHESKSSEFIFSGRLSKHVEPLTGAEGKPGTSIFFSDYEISDDFHKEMLIRKIESGEKIKQTDTESIGERGYVDGDIILTPKRVVYRIKKSVDGEVDVEEIGRISNPRIPKKLEDILGEELKTNRLVINFSTLESEIKAKSNGTIPNYFYYLKEGQNYNFEDSSIYNLVANDSSILNGSSDSTYDYKRCTFKASVTLKSNLSPDTQNKIDPSIYSYFAKLYIKCNKKYSGPESTYDSCVFIKSNTNGFDFYKEMQIPISLDPLNPNKIEMDISQLDKIFISENGFNSKYYFPSDNMLSFYKTYYILKGIKATVTRRYNNGPLVTYFDASVNIKDITNTAAKKSEILPKQIKKIKYSVTNQNPVKYEFSLDGPRVSLHNDSSVRYGSREMDGEKQTGENNVAFNSPTKNVCLFRRGDSASASNYFLEYIGISSNLKTNDGTSYEKTSYNFQNKTNVINLLDRPRTSLSPSILRTAMTNTLNEIFNKNFGWAEFVLINNETGEETIYKMNMECTWTWK